MVIINVTQSNKPFYIQMLPLFYILICTTVVSLKDGHEIEVKIFD
jgi:hypothetical protein